MVKGRKKIKVEKIESDDMVQVRNLLILLVSVVVICIGFFFLTEKMIEKDEKKEEIVKDVKIDYDIASVGTIFNRPEDEYYVLLYSSEKNSNDLDSILNAYRSSDNYIKTYYVDLDLKINSSANGDSTVKEPKNSNEVVVNEPTLYNIKNSKVVNTYIGVEDISNILK